MVERVYALSVPVVAAGAVPAAGERVLLSRFSCSTCAYGATSRTAPERCPMCGGTDWEFEPAPTRER